MFHKVNLKDYPVNVRFAQRLKDLNVDISGYFEIDENDVDKDYKKQLADTLYVTYYKSEIGLEELDLFDMKCKDVFKRNVSIYVGILKARENLVASMVNAVESESTHTGSETITFNNELQDVSTKDVTSATEHVYQEVVERETSKEYDVAHKKTGTDTRTPNFTDKVIKKGDPEFYNKYLSATADVFERFAKLFDNLFMEVL
jgi:hypothetical protein